MLKFPASKDHRMLLPNGWWLSPAGEQIRLGDFPMNAALSQDERYLAVSHSGESRAEDLADGPPDQNECAEDQTA